MFYVPPQPSFSRLLPGSVSAQQLRRSPCPRRAGRWPSASLALLALLGCSGAMELPLGQLELRLSSGSADSYYRLSNATFEIRGDHSASLSSEQQPQSPLIGLSLPVGAYEVELLEGWQLLHVTPDGEQPARAQLRSEARLAFDIRQAERTQVFFEFETAAAATDPLEGKLSVGIRVNGATGASLVISEVMRDPASVRDTAGEWLELYNAGLEPFNLVGCTLSRNTQSISFPALTILGPGDLFTLANGPNPGFNPDMVYRGLTLPNDSDLELSLQCGSQQLDTVQLSREELPDSAGVSLSLSSNRLDANLNDQESSWCAARSSFNGDLGTPGQPNPACAPRP